MRSIELDREQKDEEDDDRKKMYIDLYLLYIFADKYRMIGLMNHIIDTVGSYWPLDINDTIYFPHEAFVKFIWDHTTSDSSLRKIIIYMFVYHLATEHLRGNIGSDAMRICPDLAKDLVSTMSRRIDGSLPKSPHYEDKDTLYVKE